MLYLKDMSDIPRCRSGCERSWPAAGYQLMDGDPRAFWLKFAAVNREDWTGQKLDVTTWEDEISFVKWTLTAITWLSFAPDRHPPGDHRRGAS